MPDDRGRHPEPPAVVRPATDEDLDAVVGLTWAVAAEGLWIGTEVPFDRHARRERLAAMVDADDATLLVADAPGTGAVGHISVHIAPFGVADIGMLLADGWRGRGLGGALLDAGLAWAAGAGAHKAWLEVWPHNTAAIALYRSRGFVEEGRKVAHYRRASGELWDGLLMGRPLAAGS